ncbi:MAG: 16S rRNA processing protein RimM [Firmicutes bacterium]|nr:16S rRNA processing protein RimM [Bacillota bacterium]
MNHLIKLGRITAPVGIKGELRVYPYTDDMTRFSDIKSLLLDGQDRTIQKARYQKNMVILKLSGIDDRNTAELHINKELFLRREDLWEIPEDTYFVDDIMGIRVVSEDGAFEGTLTAILPNPAHDLYQITPAKEGAPFVVPAVKEFIRKVDLTEGVMTVKLIEGMTEL